MLWCYKNLSACGVVNFVVRCSSSYGNFRSSENHLTKNEALYPSVSAAALAQQRQYSTATVKLERSVHSP
jgi:hypothetical protein